MLVLSTLLVGDPAACIVLLAGSAVAGVCSMLVFNRFAPQERLELIDRMTADVQKRLKDHDGQFSEAVPLW